MRNLVVMVFFTLASYNIADYISPPVTEDRHRYMPVGNLMKSIICGFISAVVAFLVSVKALKQRKKIKYPFDRPLR
ncbi:hypothetical protein M9991_07325 [Chryseobacterium gallinarum]|uniref:hypothetical protein n=1 Tax=Chryseobacterium gallinarum TaxID=1324352 RepID=UPI0020258B24|nr:hypothetical protein [Chryseobacterium gallinarum]MCL8536677.1 hypothetical protein [Chryseobacterium gallinarum]